MPVKKRRYSKEEFVRRGDSVYARKVLPHLKPADNGKFVAVDIESGEYEIANDELTACDRLDARVPGAQTWLVKVGSRYVHRIGRNAQQGMR
jgi:hypothetical protein